MSLKAGQRASKEPVPAIGHRERKREKLRRQLSEAALSLFEERGYEATTIDDIAARADVVKRTFFRYFRSKDDALFDWYDAMRERLRMGLTTRPRGESALRALQATAQELIEAHDRRDRITLILARLSATSAEIHARLAAVRDDTQVEAARVLAGRLNPGDALAARFIAVIVYTGAYAAVDQWTAEGASRPLGEYAEAVFAEQLEMFKEIDARYILH